MNQPDMEELPPEVLAEVARITAKQAEEVREKEQYVRNTTRNQRRVNKKLQMQQFKQHMRKLK